MLLDQEITEKGFGSEKTPFGIFWASPRIPDVFGMLPDVSGMSGAIKPSVPFRPRQTCLLPSQPTDALLPHLGRQSISPRKEREREITLEKACIKIEGPGI